MIRFKVTYDVVTPESAENGDVAESGFAYPGGWRFAADDHTVEPMSLRDALSACGRSVSRYGAGFEDGGRGFYTVDSDIDYRTGEHTTYGLHPSGNITPSSYRRLRRVLCGR